MSKPARNTATGVEDMKPELDTFYELMDEIKIAMMTTRRPDGHLESRAMANQKRADGADLWFVTDEGGDKLRDIASDPHVNLAYYKSGSYEWVSVSGIASISRDRQKIRELYEPDWKVWFGQEGDPRRCSCRRLPRSRQTEAGGAIRTGKRVADGRASGTGQDARAARAASLSDGAGTLPSRRGPAAPVSLHATWASPQGNRGSAIVDSGHSGVADGWRRCQSTFCDRGRKLNAARE
jgi:general stress protein 26